MSLVGQKCSSIDGLTFIKGDPVKVPPTGRPVIIEFWATWCGPCRSAFPHLSNIARKHKAEGLVVVGVNIEGGDGAAVRKMVVDQGVKMDYLVAIDAAQQASTKLMGAAGVSGIPCAFVIDHTGVIRHYGHPMEPKFAQIVDTVCKEAKNVAAAGPQPVHKSREELLATSIRELKGILTAWQVSFADLNEKTELVERILERCKK